MNESAADPTEPALPAGVRAVVIVGFMGAGKTRIGRLLANALEVSFVDLDLEVEARARRTIPEIFSSDGEPAFRLMEEEVAADLLDDARSLVLATGGGWGAQPGRLTKLPKGALSVWLRVSPEVAVDRTSRQAPGRPLLDAAEDRLTAARELLARRTPWYEAADLQVETDGREPDHIVRDILNALRDVGTASHSHD